MKANNYEETVESIVRNGREWFGKDFVITFKVTRRGRLKLVNMEDGEDSGLPEEMARAMKELSKTKKANYIG